MRKDRLVWLVIEFWDSGWEFGKFCEGVYDGKCCLCRYWGFENCGEDIEWLLGEWIGESGRIGEVREVVRFC